MNTNKKPNNIEKRSSCIKTVVLAPDRQPFCGPSKKEERRSLNAAKSRHRKQYFSDRILFCFVCIPQTLCHFHFPVFLFFFFFFSEKPLSCVERDKSDLVQRMTLQGAEILFSLLEQSLLPCRPAQLK
jgi:hypothetical protein